MNCGSCEKKIERGDAEKIACSDCNNTHHLICVDLKKEDLLFFKSSGNVFRCNKCAVLRRKSLQLGAASFDIPSTSSLHLVSSKRQSDKNLTAIQTALPAPNSTSVTLQLLYEEMLSLKNINKEFLNTIKNLKEENTELKSKLITLENKLNWMDQEKKQNIIEITGVNEVNNKNALQIAKDIFSDKLKTKIRDSEILNCYVKKVNKKKANKNNITTSSSVLCVKLSSYEVKKNIMKKKNAERKNLGSIYINNSLTKFYSALYMEAKKIIKQKQYKYLWFNRSNLLLKKNEDSEIVVLRSFNDLKNI